MRDPEFVFGTPTDDDVVSAFWKFNSRAGNDFILVDEFSRPSLDRSIVLFGKAGDDRLLIQNIEDVSSQSVFGGSGNDLIRVLSGLGKGGSGDDSVVLVRELDIPVEATLKGGDGNDTFFLNASAGTGTIVARGGEGDDVFSFVLDRGTGRARLTGGEGADNFGVDFTFGRATVVDFDFAEGDRLDIPPRGQIGPDGVVQEVGGSAEDPFLLVSFAWRFNGVDFFTAYKLLGVDAPLADAAFI